MKKCLVYLMALVLFLVSVSIVNADMQGRKVFAMSGEFIEYVPFSFTVPAGNCGNVKTYEYIPGYGDPKNGFGSFARWVELVPGSQTELYSTGIFKFSVDDSVCSCEIMIEGTVSDYAIYRIWQGMEQDPEDLGVLVQGLGVASNYFNLSADDRQYSYVIAFPPYSRKYTLDDLTKFANSGIGGIQPSGSTLVGVIIPDKRGYLNKIVADIKKRKTIISLQEQASGIIMDDDQIVVLIYKESY